MKQDWAFFKQLMRENTGLGWDATKDTIIADNDWWKQKIKMDHRYRRFRNMDLSLIRYRYDALFSNIVATGERAHAANEEQISETEVHLDKEKLNDFDKEHFINLNNEESHDPNDMNSPMFFKPSLKREFSTDDIGTSNRVKKSKTKSAREELHSLVELMSSKSADTSHAVEDPTIDKCVEFLESWPEIDIPSETYNYGKFVSKERRPSNIFLDD
ncbi:hypothetical protein BC332_17707 [Capsicum chinense]|nr:hypothetical protein BC332_17707 [Capsicum chinense]